MESGEEKTTGRRRGRPKNVHIELNTMVVAPDVELDSDGLVADLTLEPPVMDVEVKSSEFHPDDPQQTKRDPPDPPYLGDPASIEYRQAMAINTCLAWGLDDVPLERRVAEARECTRFMWWRNRFIKAMRTCGVVEAAAWYAGVSVAHAKAERRKNPRFCEEWDKYEDDIAKVLEEKLDQLAIQGTIEPVFNNGVQVGSKRKFSVQAAMFRLKGLRPEKYAGRQIVENRGVQNIRVQVSSHFKSPEAREALSVLARQVSDALLPGAEQPAELPALIEQAQPEKAKEADKTTQGV